MKSVALFFYRLYQYATVCIVVGSPLLFIPKTIFNPESTYYIAMMLLVTVALCSYVVASLIAKRWHTVSKLEFISYFAFVIALIGSVVFSKHPRTSLFGELINSMSAISFMTLPVIMYLVRSLPESLRNKLKYVTAIILGVSAFVFVSSFMFTGGIIDALKQIFSGFSSYSALAVYVGLFVVASLFFVQKVNLKKIYKISIVITALLFMSWAVSLNTQDGVRPNFTSTMVVAKNVMVHNGVFGIGNGNFGRAWQLYRPASVTASPYFGYDFNNGSSAMSTLFVTNGVIGLLAFLLLVITALYSTFVSYRETRDEKEHFILGLLAFSLLYFACVSWIANLSYAMLVVWMILAGLGVAKANLTEYHPSKKLALLMVPLALILLVNTLTVLQKIKSFSLYAKAQTVSTPKEAEDLIKKAASIYPYDGFYRTLVESYIQDNRNLVASSNKPEDIKDAYLANAQLAVDAGLAAVKYNPDNYQNYVSLARSYELAIPFDKDGGFDKSKKSYEEAVKLYPENPYLYIMLARLEASSGTKDGVRAQLTEALKKKRDFADALYLMSQLEASDQKISEAIAYALEAVKSAPNDPLVYLQAGLLYYGQKDYQNAVAALNTALQKDPKNANVAYFLALSLRDGGRPDLAKQIASELLKQNPSNPDLQSLINSLDSKPVSTKSANKK